MPAIKVRLNGNSLRTKFSTPKARWHGKYPGIGDVVKAAWEAGMPPAFQIIYVKEEN